MQADRKRWEARYRKRDSNDGNQADFFLKKHIHFLPRGKALDLAAGEGRNAVFLSAQGFDVEAVDISKVALAKARKLAREKGVKIKTVVADLDSHSLGKEQYDLILDFYFLDRRLIPGMKRALKTGGRIVFSTYLAEHPALGVEGPTNPKYLLKPNELLKLFKDFRVLFYREGIFKEEGKKRAIASLIAEKIQRLRKEARGRRK